MRGVTTWLPKACRSSNQGDRASSSRHQIAAHAIVNSSPDACTAILEQLGHNGGYDVTDLVHGDTVTEVLNYVQFRGSDLLQTFRRKVGAAKHLSRQEANMFIADYVAGLEGYTYLEGDAAQ